MRDSEQLTELLQRAVRELPGGPVEQPGPQLTQRAQRRLRRRRAAVVSSACAAVLALAVPATVLAQHGRATRQQPVTPSGAAATAATAARLAQGAWSDLPAAPLTARSEPVAVWTGAEMLVWGGFVNGSSPRYFADGAAYDLNTRTWRTLPASPLTARHGAVGVWTGDELVVWGGAHGDGGRGETAPADGAAYNPRTNRWRMLPVAPLTGRIYATAFVLNGRIVILGGRPAMSTATDYVRVDAAEYDPQADRWERLPDLPATPGHDVDRVIAGPRDGRLYAVLQWHRTTPNSDNSYSETGGYDAVEYDFAAGRWGKAPAPPMNVGPTGLVPTSAGLVMPAAAFGLYGAAGPRGSNLHGQRLVAGRGWVPMSHGPADDLRGDSLWTGAALVTYNTGTYLGSGAGASLPGNGAVWDPARDSWQPLPNAGWWADAPAAVWTGDTLLMWGAMYQVRRVQDPVRHSPVAHGLSYAARTPAVPGASGRPTCVSTDRFGTGPGPRYVQITPPDPAASRWSLRPGGSVDLALPVAFLPGTEPGRTTLFVLPYGQAPDSRTEGGNDPRLVRTLTATSVDSADGSRTYHFRIDRPENSPKLAAGRYSIGFLASGSPPLTCGSSLRGTAATLGILGTLTVSAP